MSFIKTTRHFSLANSTAAQTLTVDLPRDMLVTKIIGELDTVGSDGTVTTLGGAGTITMTSIQMQIDNMVFWRTFGGQNMGQHGAIYKWETGVDQRATGASSTTPAYHFELRADPTRKGKTGEWVWPTLGASFAQLALDVTTSQGSANYRLHLTIEGITGESAKGRKTRAIHRFSSLAGAAGEQRIRIPRNAPIAWIAIANDDPENVEGGLIQLVLDSGASVPVSTTWRNLRTENLPAYFDETIPAWNGTDEIAFIDFAPEVLDPRKADAVELVYVGEASGTGGTEEFLICQVFELS